MVVDKGYEKAAHLYDLFDTKDNIDFFYHYGKEAKSILDIGAGTGRIAIPLAEKGVNVVCIEPSPAMRHEFNKKLKNNPNLNKLITLIASDAQSFKLNDLFSAAFLSGSFDHFSDEEERISVLNNINNHLKLGGKLVFDIFIGFMRDSPLSLVDTIKRGELEYQRFIENRILPRNKINVRLIYKIIKKGKLIEEIEQKSSASIITRNQVHKLLEKTGFKIKNEFRDYNFSPFKEGSPVLIIEAIKEKKEKAIT
ncbi:MAG: class I SAM-dependent methyltransferase [Candidatus Hodarchaeota archaeon]